MKRLLLIILLFTTISVHAQRVLNGHINLGVVDSVQSKILGEKRDFWVYVPGGAPNDFFTKPQYPMVYVLDGDGHFAALVGMLQEFSELNGNTATPKMIVVGIRNTDRTRDLTPTHSLIDYKGRVDSSLKTSGGGEKFTAFIQQELMPHIDSVYPTAPYRTLIGHSFGGITAMNIFLNHTDLFNNYITIDPSMCWDNSVLLKQSHDKLKAKRFAGKSLYLAIANTMPPGMDTATARRDTSGETAHIRAILHLADELKSNPGNGLNWKYRYYDDDGHSSVPVIAMCDGLRFLFNFYKYPNDVAMQLFDPKAKVDIATFFPKHYAMLSAKMGYAVKPPEDMLNFMGYYFMQSGAMDKSFAAFAANIQFYPASNNVYDSMGDYYATKKDKAKAIEFFRKALKIKEAKETRDKLNEWTAKK